MDKYNDLKEMITTRLKNFIKLNLENKKNKKYILKDFNEINIKPISSAVTFIYHPMFKDV